MNWNLIGGALVGAPFLFACLSASWAQPTEAPANAAPPAIEWIAEARIPAATKYDGACVGGLSALDRSSADGRYVLLSDARNSPRFFTARIDLVPATEDKPARIEVAFDGVTSLVRKDGRRFSAGSVDPEGLALTGDHAWVSSEGVASRGIPPFVRLFSLADGRQRQSLPLPPGFEPRLRDGELKAGVANNRAFEALALNPSGDSLWVGTEATLVQERGGPRRSALIRYDLSGETPRIDGEYRYPLRRPPVPGTSIGLVEFLILEDGRHLALERSFGPLTGMIVSLFEWQPNPGEGTPTVSKRRWATLNELGIQPENLEAVTEVPGPQGAVDLLLVSDNNDPGCTGRAAGQPAPDTQFLWLRIRDERRPE